MKNFCIIRENCARVIYFLGLSIKAYIMLTDGKLPSAINRGFNSLCLGDSNFTQLSSNMHLCMQACLSLILAVYQGRVKVHEIDLCVVFVITSRIFK